jgi:phosphohistidine phosphatase
MTLYLVHHGDAVGPDVDPMRPLSARGRREVESLASRAAAHGVKPDVIWHSGKLRARQTAELFRRACQPLATCAAARGLQPDDPPGWAIDLLMEETRRIMLVGHMPHLPRLLRLLVAGTPDADRPDFPPHGIVELVGEQEKEKEEKKEKEELGRVRAKWVEVWRASNIADLALGES